MKGPWFSSDTPVSRTACRCQSIAINWTLYLSCLCHALIVQSTTLVHDDLSKVYCQSNEAQHQLRTFAVPICIYRFLTAGPNQQAEFIPSHTARVRTRTRNAKSALAGSVAATGASLEMVPDALPHLKPFPTLPLPALLKLIRPVH